MWWYLECKINLFYIIYDIKKNNELMKTIITETNHDKTLYTIVIAGVINHAMIFNCGILDNINIHIIM